MDPFQLTLQTGLYPQQPCAQCARPLNADGAHPAELYAGTYTGLCDVCTFSGFRLLGICPLDGARELAHPPLAPSWRRDRPRFIGYSDCASCAGAGRAVVPRSCALGGSYAINCKPCLDRYLQHPVRIRIQKRDRAIRAAAEAAFRSYCAAGMDFHAARLKALSRYHSASDRLRSLTEATGAHFCPA